jgi:hypothetical protein
MTSRAIEKRARPRDGVSIFGIGEMFSHAKLLPNVRAQGMAALADIPCRYLLGISFSTVANVVCVTDHQ